MLSETHSNSVVLFYISSYFVSKLIHFLLARAMTERLGRREVQDVVVNTLTPGYCFSDLTANTHGLTAVGFWLLSKATARTT